jgi:hypothetical protein
VPLSKGKTTCIENAVIKPWFIGYQKMLTDNENLMIMVINSNL